MKFYIWALFLFLVACSSEKGASPSVSSEPIIDEELVTEADYQPIEEGLDIIQPEIEEPKKNQYQLIL